MCSQQSLSDLQAAPCSVRPLDTLPDDRGVQPAGGQHQMFSSQQASIHAVLMCKTRVDKSGRPRTAEQPHWASSPPIPCPSPPPEDPP